MSYYLEYKSEDCIKWHEFYDGPVYGTQAGVFVFIYNNKPHEAVLGPDDSWEERQ